MNNTYFLSQFFFAKKTVHFAVKDLWASEVIGLDNDELQNAPKNEVRTLQLNQVNQGVCSERLDPNGGSCFESVSCIFRCKIKGPAYDGECKSGPHLLLKCYCNTPCPTQPPPSDTFNPPLSAPANPTPDTGKAKGGEKKKHPPHSAPEETPSGDAPEETPTGDAPDYPPYEDDLAPESGEEKEIIKKKPPRDSSPTIPVNPHPSVPINPPPARPVNPSPIVPAIPPPTIPIISPPGLPGSPPPFCSARYDPSDNFCVSSTWCAVRCKVRGPTYGGECKSDTHMLTRCYCNFPCAAQQPPTAPVNLPPNA